MRLAERFDGCEGPVMEWVKETDGVFTLEGRTAICTVRAHLKEL